MSPTDYIGTSWLEEFRDVGIVLKHGDVLWGIAIDAFDNE